jgi:hypothetical protein
LIYSQVIAAALKDSSKGIKRITAAENYVQLANKNCLYFLTTISSKLAVRGRGACGSWWKRSKAFVLLGGSEQRRGPTSAPLVPRRHFKDAHKKQPNNDVS